MRKRSLMSTFFIFLLSILLVSAFKIEAFAQTTPKVAIVSLDHVPFVQGDNNEFYISAKGYTGQVQYQLFYIQESVMKTWKLIDNADMVNGWTKSVEAQSPTIVSISALNLQADKYRFAIRVRRVGVKGLYANSYGDYDDAYPFNLDVAKNASIKLNDNINIEKTDLAKGENLVINGVGNLSNDVQYKLHLYDVKNNKWLTDLTQYATSINYSLESIPEGTYIVDLWSKNTNSNNKYDGWKLKVITIKEKESILDSAKLKVNYINVGQGDSILIQQGSSSMLIDAGNNADSEIVKSYISNEGITKLDYVIGTHPHEDHIGGLDYVINSFQVGKIYMPKATSTTKTFEDLVTAIKNKGMNATVQTPGESFKLGEATCIILAPNGSGYADANNESIVIKITFGGNSFLFTGDAEDVSENEMLSKGYDLKADVLKIGHHGSTSSTTQKFLEAVNPKYAVISVGAGNTYGHPAKETIDRLNSKNISVYRTDESGDIIATSDGTNITFNVKPSENTVNNEEPIEQSKTDVKITSVGLESEIVTIKNFGTTDVNMTGWRLLSTVGMQNYNLPSNFILKAGTSVYITSGANAKDDGKSYLKWTGSYIWNNSGDLGELYDLNNQLVSSK